MKERISITAMASVSPLGSTMEEVWKAYQNSEPYFDVEEYNGAKTWVARLSPSGKSLVEVLRASNSTYGKLDNSVLYAMAASRMAIANSGWQNETDFGINLGSSRGATSLFESYHKEYLESGSASTLSSPTTTLGNISSWVSHDLGTSGPEISHSITCSTGLHSILNGIAWINSGMAEKFLVGGSEAPLTDFTIAQMKALKIYAPYERPHQLKVGAGSRSYPCKAYDLEKKRNSMVLGEGACIACLEKGVSSKAMAIIEGIGYATETLVHNTSISTDATCFQKSMKMAMAHVDPSQIDAVVMHAPGTLKGDLSEVNAIRKVFGKNIPFLTTNKWKLGHTFAPSGMFNLEMAVLMLRHDQVLAVPYLKIFPFDREVKKVMVNAVGFGGNAVSIVITKPI